MKKVVFTISFLVSMFAITCCGQGQMSLREIYYQVDEKGNINDRETLGERVLVYSPNRGMTKIEYCGGFRHNLDIRNVDVYNVESAVSEKSAPVYDEQKRLVEYREPVDSVTWIKYFVSYNQYDDPVEVKPVLEKEDGSVSVLPTVTFKYFYFCDVPSLEPKDKELDYYRRVGIISSERGCPWMLRTINKDGLTVQHAERKYGSK